MNEAYRETIFLLEPPTSVLPRDFCFVTAYNPFGKTFEEAQNQQFDLSLKHRLDTERLPCFRVVGASHDLAHQEAGWGIICDEEAAVGLGKLYFQEAIFKIADGIVWLIDCDDIERRFNLGPFRSRILRPDTA